MDNILFIRTLLFGMIVGLGAGLATHYFKDFTLLHAIAYGVMVGIFMTIFNVVFEKGWMYFKNKKN